MLRFQKAGKTLFSMSLDDRGRVRTIQFESRSLFGKGVPGVGTSYPQLKQHFSKLECVIGARFRWHAEIHCSPQNPKHSDLSFVFLLPNKRARAKHNKASLKDRLKTEKVRRILLHRG